MHMTIERSRESGSSPTHHASAHRPGTISTELGADSARSCSDTSAPSRRVAAVDGVIGDEIAHAKRSTQTVVDEQKPRAIEGESKAIGHHAVTDAEVDSEISRDFSVLDERRDRDVGAPTDCFPLPATGAPFSPFVEYIAGERFADRMQAFRRRGGTP